MKHSTDKGSQILANQSSQLTFCPNCKGDKFNDKTGLCLDCGYDEKSWSTGPYYDHEYDDDFDDYDHDYEPAEGDWEEFESSSKDITCSDQQWVKVASKSVVDYDGFTTDYTWYTDADGNTNIFIFGDNDIYNPYNSDPDFETEDYNEAENWFNSYEGEE